MIQLSFSPALLDIGDGRSTSYSVSTLSSDTPASIPAEALQLAETAITVSARIDGANAPFRLVSIASARGVAAADGSGGNGLNWVYQWTNEAAQAGSGPLSLPALINPPHALHPDQRRLTVAVSFADPNDGQARYGANLVVTVSSPGNPDAVATVALTAEPWRTYRGESQNDDAIVGVTHSNQHAGVRGENPAGGNGVTGVSNGGGAGVWGTNSAGGPGVHGTSHAGYGVWGEAAGSSPGVFGFGPQDGVQGWTNGGGSGVHGIGDTDDRDQTEAQQPGRVTGVFGEALNGWGVCGSSNSSDGVAGLSTGANSAGVAGRNDQSGGAGVLGISTQGIGVKAICENGSSPGLYAASKSGDAAFFQGTIRVTGDIALINQDCAEEFDVVESDSIEPGSVMVINESGALEVSHDPYDRKVAGVISGAGEYQPAIVLGKLPSQSGRRPVALVGKVCCKVDAHYAAIGVGDLLTTSPTPGHAMKAVDRERAFGAVIGKALRPVAAGRALIPILIALQ
jgi:hypothetical protein